MLLDFLKLINLKFIIGLFFIVVISEIKTIAQQLIYPLHNELNYRIEKEYFSSDDFHSDIKPFIVHKGGYFDSVQQSLNINVNSEFLDKLLNKDAISVENEKFKLAINPILTIEPGFSSESNNILHNYKFGLNLDGYFTKKLSFVVSAFYGQKSFNEQFNMFVDSTNIIPHYGEIIGSNGNIYNYYSIAANVSYQPNKYINLQLGKSKNFWGEGYRSLFLSDNSNSDPYFKATVDVGKFKYIWMVSALSDINTEKNSNELFSKLQFSHYLSWNATKWLNFNFFESIISNPVDSMGITYFNINYLNPVIFFRPVEFSGGSADNALLGIGFKLKIFKKYQFYSQFIIDEFVFSELKSGNGWWGNKFGIQTGVKVFNLLNVNNLMFLSELNYIRPFTYSYSNTIQNYGNYRQALAHPSGANIKEAVVLFHYHYKRFSVQLKGIYQISGIDTDTVSYGKDIYKSYTLRSSDYDHYITQGLVTKYTNLELKTAWLINQRNNIQIELSISSSKINNNISNTKNLSFHIGIKSLIFNESNDFY